MNFISLIAVYPVRLPTNISYVSDDVIDHIDAYLGDEKNTYDCKLHDDNNNWTQVG